MVFGGGSRRLEVLLELRDKFSAGMRNAGRQVDSLSDKLRKHRTELLAVAGGAAAAAGFSVKAASDLLEAQNRVNEVFGASAGIIQQFSEQQAAAFNLSKRAANEYTGQLGAIFTASGLARDSAAQMSVRMTKLAADLSSFANIPIDEALQKIRSGLVGQAEPLRTVGVLLSETAVQAEAMRLGLGNANGELSEGAKVQARYALILQQTTSAQGDVARTAGTFANQMRGVQRSLEDSAASIGEILLPAVTNLVTGLNRGITAFEKLSEPVKVATVALVGAAGALAAVGVLLPVVVRGFEAAAVAANLARAAYLRLLGPVIAIVSPFIVAAAAIESVNNALSNLSDIGFGDKENANRPVDMGKNIVEQFKRIGEEVNRLSDAALKGAGLAGVTDETEALGSAAAGAASGVGDLSAQMSNAVGEAFSLASGLTTAGRGVASVTAETNFWTAAWEEFKRKTAGVMEPMQDAFVDVRNEIIATSQVLHGFTNDSVENMNQMWDKSERTIGLWRLGLTKAVVDIEAVSAALLDQAEIARFARDALAAAQPVGGGLAHGAMRPGGVSVFDIGPNPIAPFPKEFAHVAPPGFAINVTVNGSVTTPDLTAIIAREMREIERRGM